MNSKDYFKDIYNDFFNIEINIETKEEEENTSKEDYIEIAAEKVNIANNNGIIEKIIAFFK